MQETEKEMTEQHNAERDMRGHLEAARAALRERPLDAAEALNQIGKAKTALASLPREDLMVVIHKDESGKPKIWCDPEIAQIVKALNENGHSTVASCSGHGHRPANIALADGREVIIARNYEEARRMEAAIPVDINGSPLPRMTEGELAETIYDINRTAVTGMIDGHFVRDLVLDFEGAKKHKVDGYIDAVDAAKALIARFPHILKEK